MRRAAARFDRIAGVWRPSVASGPVRAEQLSCATFNVWFDDYAFDQRAAALLELLAATDADIIALQEVTSPLLEQILAAAWVRERYAVSDHTGATVWPYGVLLLTRWTPQRLSLHPLPSEMGRRLLLAEYYLNGAHTAIATVHLESMQAYAEARGAQLARIFPLLAPAAHALLMGDFNFCAAWPEENERLDPAYADLWPTLRPAEPGYTEDTAINLMRLLNRGRHKQVRFDRVLLRSHASAWLPEAIQLLGDQPIGPDTPAIFPSDHFGLLARLRWDG